MASEDFFAERQRAVERMKEMSGRAVFKDAPDLPHFVSKREERKPALQKTVKGNLPLLKMLGSESDVSLILGLILLLSSENGDRLLLYALMYLLL